MKTNKRATAQAKRLAVAGFMTIATLSSSALSTSYYASTSRLATGHWVKVRVTSEGMQQITYDELRAWGFSNPAKVKVFGYGGTLLSDHVFSNTKPDDLQPTLSLHTEDGRLIFFGDAEVRTVLAGTDSKSNLIYTVNRNYTSNAGYYLLSDVDVEDADATAIEYVSSTGTPVSQHLSVNLYEKEAVSLGVQSNIFHTQTYAGGEYITTTFNVRDYAASDDGYATYSMEVPILNTASLTTYTVSAATCSNLTVTATQSCTADSSYDGTLSYNTGTGRYQVTPADGETTIADGDYTFKSLIPTNKYLSYVALDRAVLIYPRKNVMHSEDGNLLMNFQSAAANSNFTVEGASSSTHVWNVSSPAQVYEHKGVYDAETSTFTGTFDRTYSTTGANGPCRLIAFDAAQQQNSVSYVGEVANQNVHADSTPDMIIITTDELVSYAEDLAEAHRQHDGMDVNVYTQQQLFNEFGSGTPTPMAVRRAIKMFYDRNKSKLKYVLMYGKSLVDYRQIVTSPSYEPLITFEVEPITTRMKSAASNAHLNFATDDYFGYLKDTDTPTNLTVTSSSQDVAVGRIPARNVGYASDVNTKLIDYMTQERPVELPLQALLVSDNGDSNQHFKQSLNVKTIFLDNQPSTTVIQGHCLIYPHTSSSAKALRSVITNSLTDGVGYFCYTGHGAETSFAAEKLWDTSGVNNTDYKYSPFAMLSTCNSSCYDRTTTGIADVMLQKNNGGMIAVICSARSVLLDSNKLICEAVSTAYASARGTVTIGDLYKTAHNSAIKKSSRDTDLYNTLCYNLCGDPAIKITMPQRDVTFTDINNVNLEEYYAAVADGSLSDENSENSANYNLALMPESIVNIKAYVADADGNVDATYNGKATITVYEAPHEVSTIKVDSKDVVTTTTLDETVLTKVVADVVNGKISADVFLPTNSYPTSSLSTNRIVIVTENEDGITACGKNTDAYVNGSLADNTTTVDVVVPEISELYIDKPEYGDGAVVGTTSPTLYGTIKLGTAGLSTSNRIGSVTSISLDGTNLSDAGRSFVVGTDGTATLQYQFSDLTAGEHTAIVTVADNASNVTRQSISFTVQELGGEITLAADTKTAYESVTLDVSHTFYATPDTRLVIEDSQRNTVLSVENATFPYEWNLQDSDGAQVANGYYNVYILAKYGTAIASSEKVEVVVLAEK